MTDHQIDPDYYQGGTMQVIDAIEGLNLSTHESHALKYLARWRMKHADPAQPDHVTDGMIADLEKCQWWVGRLLRLARNQRKKWTDESQ